MPPTDRPKEKTEKDSKFLSDIKNRYTIASDAWRDIYTKAEDDTRFAYDVGEGQWPDAIRHSKQNSNKPCLTINKLQKYIRRLRGEMQMNRPHMKVIPVDDKADVQRAEIYNGIIRQLEYLSNASVAYDTAYNHAVTGGVGYWRILTDYVDDDSFDQEIKIKRIINPFSVYFDPSAKEFNFEDAKYCFITDLMEVDEYKAQYPDSSLAEFEGVNEYDETEWLYEDKVRIAEYFYKEPHTVTKVLLDSGEVLPLEDGVTKESLEEQGEKIADTREVTEERIMWCKLNGVEVIEGPTPWVGKYIPIIPVFGDEVMYRGRRNYLSLIRGAKGSQEMYNYWSTIATESVAQVPKTPFILEARQIRGYEEEWNDANTISRPYLRYKHINNVPKPQREQPATIQTGIMSMLQTASFDIEDNLGQYAEASGQPSNARTGKAIQLRINQSDKGNYTFGDNLTRAMVYSGKQIINLIPKIYDSTRTVLTMDETGNAEITEINKPEILMTNTGPQSTVKNDLSVGRYDLIAIAGPSYGSRRQEMMQMITEAMQYAKSPEISAVLTPLLFEYSDYPGATKVAGMLKQAIGQTQQNGVPPEGDSR